MAPPTGTTATTSGPAPDPPSPPDTRGRTSRTARNGGLRRPRCRLGHQPAAAGGPRRSRAAGRGARAGRGGPPCRSAPRGGPGCTRTVDSNPGKPCHGPGRPRRAPRHAPGAGDRLSARPKRLAGGLRSRSGGQGGRQVLRPPQAQPHPHQPPKAVPAESRLP